MTDPGPESVTPEEVAREIVGLVREWDSLENVDRLRLSDGPHDLIVASIAVLTRLVLSAKGEAAKNLAKYGRHLSQCGILRAVCPAKSVPSAECWCGLSDALAAELEGR